MITNFKEKIKTISYSKSYLNTNNTNYSNNTNTNTIEEDDDILFFDDSEFNESSSDPNESSYLCDTPMLSIKSMKQKQEKYNTPFRLNEKSYKSYGVEFKPRILTSSKCT